MLNYEFWAEHLPPSTAELASGSQLLQRRETTAPFDRKVAMRFLRSYAFLIQHRLDFILACENHLIPDNVDWMKWCNFIAHFLLFVTPLSILTWQLSWGYKNRAKRGPKTLLSVCSIKTKYSVQRCAPKVVASIIFFTRFNMCRYEPSFPEQQASYRRRHWQPDRYGD